MELCEEKGIRYPKATFFIITNEFCERFSFYGMKTVLALYLTNSLRYDMNTSTMIYHSFNMLCYFFPLFGAIIADSYLGKFKTILYLSIVHALGNIAISIGAIPVSSIPQEAISLLGLLFLAIGTGGIKPCVSSFGGDQFILPQQSLQLQRFFSYFYFSINAGGLLSTLLTPYLRNDIKCFGRNDCFPLAFGVPAIFMCISLGIFIFGKQLYRMKEPEENIIVSFSKCIFCALRNKISGKKQSEDKSYWLEYADDKFSREQINEFRSVLNVLILFTPVPLYWALADQQGSRWIYQATSMDGRIFGFVIRPDQIHFFNPFFVLIFIPLFETYIYPKLRKIGIKHALQKMVIGGWCIVLSFIFSTAVEYKVQDSYGVLSVNGEGQLRIFNSLECKVTMNPPIQNVSLIDAFSSLELLHIPVTNSVTSKIIFDVGDSCPYKLNRTEFEINVFENKKISYFISQTLSHLKILATSDFDDTKKNSDGLAKVRLFSGFSDNSTKRVVLQSTNNPSTKLIFCENSCSNNDSGFILVPPGKYDLFSDSRKIETNIYLNPGEIDTIIMRENSTYSNVYKVNMVPWNRIHILWQLPQIVVLTISEILFSITGLEFSFTQAPLSMKSILSSAWLLTTAVGNLIVVVISKLHLFNFQIYEFILFTGLMIINMIVLMILAKKYKYNTSDSSTK